MKQLTQPRDYLRDPEGPRRPNVPKPTFERIKYVEIEVEPISIIVKTHPLESAAGAFKDIPFWELVKKEIKKVREEAREQEQD